MAHKPKQVGGNLTISDVSTGGGVSVNSSTATTLVAEDEKRTYLEISNPHNQSVWIKLQAASVDDNKSGIFIPSKGRWVMGDSDKYTGEVSAIMNSGASKIIPVVTM